HWPNCTSMKSVTWAACKRSIRLPIAPPMMNASGSAVRQSRRAVRASHITSTALMTSANTTKSQRCQPSPMARKLKAAPGLNASVQLRKPGITGCGWPAGCSAASAHHLLSWSRAMTRAESSSQGSALGLVVMRKLWRMNSLLPPGEGAPKGRMRVRICRQLLASSEPSPQPLSRRERGSRTSLEPAACLTRPFHIAHAATAEFRVIGVLAHVVAAVPAAHALGRLADGGRDPYVGAFQLGEHGVVRLAAGLAQAHVGSDEEEAQLIHRRRVA